MDREGELFADRKEQEFRKFALAKNADLNARYCGKELNGQNEFFPGSKPICGPTYGQCEDCKMLQVQKDPVESNYCGQLFGKWTEFYPDHDGFCGPDKGP